MIKDVLSLHRSSTSRKEALQKLWSYICSVVADSILRWNIVITRFGKPSISEIRGLYVPLLHIPYLHSHTSSPIPPFSYLYSHICIPMSHSSFCSCSSTLLIPSFPYSNSIFLVIMHVYVPCHFPSLIPLFPFRQTGQRLWTMDCWMPTSCCMQTAPPATPSSREILVPPTSPNSSTS